MTPEERVKKLDANWEITEHIPWPEEVLADIGEAIRAAAAAQKERDAKMIESRGRFLPVDGDTLQDSIDFERRCIAAAIREGGE